MSIATEISRLQSAKASIKTAIEGKGVTVPSATLLDGYAALISSIPTGGSGSIPLVTGTFTANSSSGAQTVSLAYTGNKYPVMAVLYPEGGMSSENTTWYNMVHRYAIGFWTFHKTFHSTTPTYGTSGNENAGVTMATYKSSTSSATTYARAGAVGIVVYSSDDASAASTTCVRFKSATSMSVYISGTSYGLAPGVTYRYIIFYAQ